MILSNGYYQLPQGKMANAVTWLELTDLKDQAIPRPEGFSLRRLTAADAGLHRDLYRSIGQPWLWSGLLEKDADGMQAYLADPAIASFAVLDGSRSIGLLDLEAGAEGMEVVYFGFVPTYTGRGAGRWLMGETVRFAREAGHSRLWLHTCNFDHPKALQFYQQQGFTIYSQGFEIMDDPRRSGLLPIDSAPHVPHLRHV